MRWGLVFFPEAVPARFRWDVRNHFFTRKGYQALHPGKRLSHHESSSLVVFKRCVDMVLKGHGSVVDLAVLTLSDLDELKSLFNPNNSVILCKQTKD